MGPKILNPENIWKKILGLQKFRSEKILGKKIFVQKNFGPDEVFGFKKFLGSKKFIGFQKSFWVPKKFLGSKKDFGFQKRFWFQKSFWIKKVKRNLCYKKTDENSQFQFGNFENPEGGVSIFQKCLNYKSGSDPILERRIEN